MDFCPECQAYMIKNITQNNEIVFECTSCSISFNGNDDDTLLDEDFLEVSLADSVHGQFVDNSAFDEAANIVMRDCKKCGLNFMTKIRIGILQNTNYTCTCGHVEVAFDV